MRQLGPPAFSESPGDDDSGDVRDPNFRIDLIEDNEKREERKQNPIFDRP